jgi:hypothetical protein
MTPPFDIDAACAGCFLNERTGGVCPVVLDAYDLEELRLAVRADAGSITTLVDLVRHDAKAMAGSKPTLALMPGAPKSIVNESNEKEVEYAPARSVRK